MGLSEGSEALQVSSVGVGFPSTGNFAKSGSVVNEKKKPKENLKHGNNVVAARGSLLLKRIQQEGSFPE